MLFYRKLFVVLVLSAGVGLLIWFCQQKATQPESRIYVDARTSVSGSSSNGSGSSQAVKAGQLGRPSQSSDVSATRNGNVQSSGGANTFGLYDESVRALMRSNRVAKVDYGLSLLWNACRSFLYGEDAITAVKRSPSLPQEDKGDALVVGNANEAMRLAGFQRSLDKCTKLYEGAKLSQGEQDATGALPTVVKYRAIRNTLGTATSFDDPATIAALSDAVSGPMFGALSPLLSSKLDYSELANAYRKDQIDALRSLTIPLVLCRMGDDCGPGGLVTEQLCWEYGVCGDRVEDAIFANLRAHGLDTAAFSQFILRVHQGLLTLDTSIFRKQKTGK